MTADLHVHSTFSDGSLSPKELVDLSNKQGLKTIGLTDHDTVDGLKQGIKYGKKHDIEVIPGIEFSTFRNQEEIHILGYYIDYEDQNLLARVDEIYTARQERGRKMVKLLREQGIDLSLEDVKETADDYLGRPHIARAMVKKGYITEMGEAFTEQYIGNGGQAYVPKYKMEPEVAIKLISQVGGIPVLAHPAFINHGSPLQEEYISELQDQGLQGLEVYHSKHDPETSNYYREVAHRLDLLITGGSDFHGENAPDIMLGDITISEKKVEKLRQLGTKI
ncbi:MAG: PHP domain-containing protein [Halanaerobiaceae bacterium]